MVSREQVNAAAVTACQWTKVAFKFTAAGEVFAGIFGSVGVSVAFAC